MTAHPFTVLVTGVQHWHASTGLLLDLSAPPAMMLSQHTTHL